MSTKLHRLLTDALAVVGLGLVGVALTGVANPSATANEPNSSGDIKVYDSGPCSGSQNDPKPGTNFWIGGTNFDDDDDLYLYVVLGTTASDPVVIGLSPKVHIGHHSTFCVGPFQLAAGQYKVFVGTNSTGPKNSMKTKVFKITAPPVTDPPVTDPPVTDPPVTDPPVTDPPVTDPPVTDPHPTYPPATDPPMTQPPVTQPPATDPPVTESSVASEPPVQPTSTVASEAPALPSTGGRSSAVLMSTGLLMVMLGGTMRVMARRTS